MYPGDKGDWHLCSLYSTLALHGTVFCRDLPGSVLPFLCSDLLSRTTLRYTKRKGEGRGRDGSFSP